MNEETYKAYSGFPYATLQPSPALLPPEGMATNEDSLDLLFVNAIPLYPPGVPVPIRRSVKVRKRRR